MPETMLDENGPITATIPPTDGPDVGEAQAALEQRLGAGVPEPVPEAAAQVAPEPEINENVWDALYGPDPDAQAQVGPVSPQNFSPVPGQPVAPQGGPSEDELVQQFIQNEALGAIEPKLQELTGKIEERYRREQLAELAEEYPQLKDPSVQQSIRQVLGAAAKQYGIDNLQTDPDLVEQAVLAEIGRRSLASATPASQVVANQGGMESGASVSGADNSGDSARELMQSILGPSAERNPFTG